MSDMLTIDYYDINSLTELIELLYKNDVPQSNHWSHVSAYLEAKAREKGVPLRGLFELTPLCNLDCKMCYVHLSSEQLGGARLLSAEEWERIILQAHSLGMMYVSLSGGECLTYPEFDRIYLFLRNLGIKTSIKTNGILLNRKRLDFFRKYPPQSITVSLYGSSDKAYRKVTGYDAFDIVYGNILELKKSGIPAYLAITPSPYMYEDMRNVIELIEKLNIPCSLNVALFTPRKETGRELSDLTTNEYINIYKMLAMKGSKKPVTIEDSSLPECSRSGKPSWGLKCSAGRSSFCVNWRGELLACDNLDIKGVSLSDFCFEDAWNQIHLDALSFPLPMECTDCVYDKVCFGCTAYRCKGVPKGHCNPSICERTKLLVKEGIYKL